MGLETIDEKTQTPNTSSSFTVINDKKKKKRTDLTRAEEEAVVWFRNSPPSLSSSNSLKHDDSSASSVTESSSSYGSSVIMEVPPVSPDDAGTESSTKLTNKKKKKSRSKHFDARLPARRIRFATDEDGNVLCETLKFQQLSEKSHSKVWWSDEELASFRMSCVKVVKAFQEDDMFLWAVTVLYPTSSSLKEKSKKKNMEGPTEVEQEEDLEDNNNEEEMQRARQILLDRVETRGLEMHISPMANQTMKHHARTVLKKKKKPRTGSQLRRKSKAISDASVLFACHLAQMDHDLLSILEEV